MEAKESCIFYADWLKGIEAIEDPEQKWTLAEHIIKYSLTGEETNLPSYLKPLAAMMRPQADRAQEKRDAIIEKRRAAGVAGNKKRWGESQKSQEVANATDESQKSQEVAIDVSVSGSVSVEDKSSFKISPHTPQGDLDGLDLKGFGIFFNRVNNIHIPEKVEESTYATQYVWRIAEGSPGFSKAVEQAMDETTSMDSFKAAMRTICNRFKPTTEYGAVKAAMAMKGLNQEQVKAVVNEINRSKAKGEPDIYETIIGKISYIKSGAKITNLQSFLKNRQ